MRAAVYAYREQVKAALDSVETARNNARIDRCIRSGSEHADRLTLRRFYPMTETRGFDWPAYDVSPQPWSLWLDENEMATPPTAVTVGGTAITIAHVIPYPLTGPPYNELQMDLSQSSAWSSGTTRQNAIRITSTYGHRLDESTGPDLAANIADTTSKTVDITATADLGVGSLIRIGNERMNVIRRSMLATGQTLALPLDAQPASQIVQVASTSGFVEDEVIMVDAEKMRVDEIYSSTKLVVRRAWDGSTIATHAGGVSVVAPRRLTVDRAACGSTASTHTAGADVMIFQFPDLVNQLTIAKAQCQFYDESTGYARTIGSGDNEREAAGARLARLEKDVQRWLRRIRDF